MLFTYRKMCASNTAAGQLILPESLKLLPLYVLSLTKSGLLRAGKAPATGAGVGATVAGVPVGCAGACPSSLATWRAIAATGTSLLLSRGSPVRGETSEARSHASIAPRS